MYPNAEIGPVNPSISAKRVSAWISFLARKKSISLLKSWNKLRGWSLTAIFQMGKWPQTASRDLAEKGREDAGWKKESLSRISGSLLHCCFGMKAVGVKGAVSAFKKKTKQTVVCTFSPCPCWFCSIYCCGVCRICLCVPTTSQQSRVYLQALSRSYWCM